MSDRPANAPEPGQFGEPAVGIPASSRPVRIEPRAVRKVIAGHPWLYANEVVQRDPGLADVDLVRVEDPDGRPLATGTYHKHSLIQVRLFTRRDEPVDAALIARRLQDALERRQARLPDETTYRLVFGECDGLPGLVVDRYGDVLVLELNTRGIFLFRDAIVDGLQALLAPRAIVLRNTSSVLAYEHLEPRTEVWLGTVDGPVEVAEGGVRFLVDVLGGQKTGLFLDQLENRLWLRDRDRCRDRTVWDVFAYAGAWGLHALAGGARHVTFVDSSAPACERIRENLALNGWQDRADVVEQNAFDHLRDMPADTAEVLVLDPPAFAKTKKDVPQAARAYVDINRVGLRQLREGGLLATSSCSFHVGPDVFREAIQRAVFQSRQRVELVHTGQQGADHPVHLNFPESLYLKTLFLRKLPYHWGGREG